MAQTAYSNNVVHRVFIDAYVVQWYIQATCATDGTGLYEGLDWLSDELGKKN